MGNASTLDILNMLVDHQRSVGEFSGSGDEALLVLPAIPEPTE